MAARGRPVSLVITRDLNRLQQKQLMQADTGEIVEATRPDLFEKMKVRDGIITEATKQIQNIRI